MFWNILHVEMCCASIMKVEMSNFPAELHNSIVENLMLGKILELESDNDFIDAKFWGGGVQADNEAGSSLNADLVAWSPAPPVHLCSSKTLKPELFQMVSFLRVWMRGKLSSAVYKWILFTIHSWKSSSCLRKCSISARLWYVDLNEGVIIAH